MAQDDQINICRFDPDGSQRIYDGRARHAVNTAVLLGHFIAITGIDQDMAAAGTHQQTIGVHVNPIVLICRTYLLPQRFGYNTEDTAAVQFESTTADDKKIHETLLRK